LKATGLHLLVEYHDCDRKILNDLPHIERLMTSAAEAAEATVLGVMFHPFSPQGLSGVVVIEESHLSIHTWPEHGYAAVDFFTCGKCNPERAHEVLAAGLKASRFEKMLLRRGNLPRSPMIEVLNHDEAIPRESTHHLLHVAGVAPAERQDPPKLRACSTRR